LKRVPVQYKILACLMPLILFAGCGLKGNPLSLSAVSEQRSITQNIKAILSEDAVILKWDFYDKDAKISYIDIEKSEVGSAGNECKDCPRTFERLGQIPIKGTKPENKESHTLSFTDKNVAKGKTYNYRIMLCDDYGVCLEGIATEINFK
jgi:hypothetical protein